MADPVAEKPAAKKPAAPPEPPARSMYWRVAENRKVSIRGVVTQFHKDQVLCAAHYSHEGIAELRRSGLSLAACEKPEEYA